MNGRRPGRHTLLLTSALCGLALAVACATAAATTTAASADGTGTSRPHAVAFARGHYCASFVSHLARDLGVSEDRLQSAVTRAARETIDEAVASGDLTTKQANALKSYISGRSICSLGGHGAGRGSSPSPTAGRPVTHQIPHGLAA